MLLVHLLSVLVVPHIVKLNNLAILNVSKSSNEHYEHCPLRVKIARVNVYSKYL